MIRRATLTLCVLALAAACNTSDDATSPTTGGTGATGGTGSAGGSAAKTYVPFGEANLQAQLLRVGAYEEIQRIRTGDAFSAADFGTSCETWSPGAPTPSAPTKIGSLYVETAELSTKVESREDDHDINKGAAIGAEIHGRICGAIFEGGAVAETVDKDVIGGIAWQAQVVDKSLQHFFYLSVFHELSLGARAKWDEGFGYTGFAQDGDLAKAQGIAKTARSRDENCGTTYGRDLFAKLVEGHAQLDAALKAEGKDGNEDTLAKVPDDLAETIGEIDRLFLEVFAISMAREFIELAAGEEPAIKLIEGRSFFRILEPHLRAADPDLAAKMAAEVDRDDPTAVDTTLLIGAVKTVFGIDVPALCAE